MSQRVGGHPGAPPGEIVAVIAAATVVALHLGLAAPLVTALAAAATPGPSPWALAGRLGAAGARRSIQRRPAGRR